MMRDCHFNLINEIIDHEKDGKAVSVHDAFPHVKDGQKV